MKKQSDNGHFRTDSPRSDWQTEAELFREQEWALCREIFQVARYLPADMRNRPRRVSLSQVVTLAKEAAILGRRACGLPIDDPPGNSPTFPPNDVYLAMEQALKRTYGSGGSAAKAQEQSLTKMPSAPERRFPTLMKAISVIPTTVRAAHEGKEESS